MMRGVILGGMLLLSGAQWQIPMRTGAVASGCGSFALTNQFLPANTGLPTGSVGMVDAVGGNSATNGSSPPTYTASGLNGKPILTGNGTSQNLSVTTTIPNSSWTTTTTVEVLNSTALAGYFFAGANSTSLGATFGSSHQKTLITYGSDVGVGTSTFSTGTWYALVQVTNISTGAWQLYLLSGGTYTADGSGTYSGGAIPITTGTTTFFSRTGGAYFSGSIAELDFYNGTPNATWLTNAACYVHARYGI